jgi:cell wall assembly regulator SMI1
MPTIQKSLNTIEGWLKNNRPAYLAKLQPGATAGDLDALEARLGLTLPPGFRALYQWHNGQDPKDFHKLVENYTFQSLDWIAGAKSDLDGLIGKDFEDPDWWKREWVPFLTTGGGDSIVVDLTADGAGRLLLYDHEEPDRDEVAAGIDEWLEQLADSMLDGSYEVF